LRGRALAAPAINVIDHSNHEAEFFICPWAVQDVAHSNSQDEKNFMNLNFAFACMIVVSFAIALGHS
jgi:hypothetical protein